MTAVDKLPERTSVRPRPGHRPLPPGGPAREVPRQPPPEVRPWRRPWLGLAVLALPTLLASMDLTVLHLAVPKLSEGLTPTSSQLLWMVDIYGFMVAGLLITMGNLGDRIGRRRLLLVGAAAFAVLSVVAAAATSAEMLIAARAALGVAGATLLPSTLGLIRHMFVDERQRAAAVGVWVAVFSAGTAIGPVVGGALLDHFWWGSVFLVGPPVALALLVLGPLVLPEARDPAAGRLDLRSAALSLAAVLAVIYGLKHAAEHGLGGPAVAAVGLGLAAGAAFVARQRRLDDPLIDVGLFRHPAFSGALGAKSLTLVTWAGSYLFVTQYLQLVEGLSPMEAGLWLLPVSAGSVAGGALAPLAARRIRLVRLLQGGLALAALGLGLLTLVDVGSGLPLALCGSLLISTGSAVVVSVGTDLVVGSAPPERAGTAAGISETGDELGLAMGVALIGSVGTAVYRHEVADHIPSGTPEEVASAAHDTLGGALGAARHLPAGLAADLTDGAREAFVHGLQSAALAGAVVALAAAAAVGILLRRVGEPRTTPAPAPTRPTSGGLAVGMLSFTCADAAGLARFWAGVLGLSVAPGADEAYATLVPGGPDEPTWMFVRGDPPGGGTAGDHGFHPDLSGPAWEEEVDRVVALGARLLGRCEAQGVRWVELADPEGNRFNVFAPRASHPAAA